MTELTQAQVEQRMHSTGREAAAAAMLRAEEAGRASQNRYASYINDNFVLPLAEQIREDLENSVPGRHRAHVILLKPLDPEKVAALAVRHAMNTLMRRATNHRELGYGMGRTVHRELVLAQIEIEAPELYHTLARDMARRLSTDERHKVAVYKDQAKKAGIVVAEWGLGSRDQVGLYIMGIMETQGLIDLGPILTVNKKIQYRTVSLVPEVMKAIDQIKGFVLETSPAYGPCVELPRPWTTNTDGGFHTAALRRTHRMLVKCASTARSMVRDHDMPIVRTAVNALQGTRWAVNGQVLDLITEMARAGIATKEIISVKDKPKPERAPWMDTVAKEDMTAAQAAELKAWKLSMAGWYTERKLLTATFGRFYTATRQAREFREAAELFFVYFGDSRGRLYPMTYGVNPQGSDMQKALLKFAVGLPVHTEHAELWFHVQGANKWGFDKAKLKDRAAWVKERKDLFLDFARNPLDNLGWMEADKPLQFIAWCFEYLQFHTDPGFVSHLPISMDGSCNGLQNFSAMLRDDVGGRATNLTNNDESQDIYAQVADAAFQRLLRMPEDEAGLRSKWIAHGINRKVTKKSVMTTPYGVTRNSAAKYVAIEYLDDPKIQHPFEPEDHGNAARYVMGAIWPAIGDVVVKSREAMTWLRGASKSILEQHKKDGNPDPVISWFTPSGFLATQGYFELQIHRINTLLHGTVKIRVASETDDPDAVRHASGIAPNFVHSMDASHLHLVAARAAKEGIRDLAMIHDDYGTHAAHSQRLFHIIREEFHAMYTNHDPMADLAARYPCVSTPPAKGTLDLDEVLQSEFFFS